MGYFLYLLYCLYFLYRLSPVIVAQHFAYIFPYLLSRLALIRRIADGDDQAHHSLLWNPQGFVELSWFMVPIMQVPSPMEVAS
mgnify:CR=1 FL=1